MDLDLATPLPIPRRRPPSDEDRAANGSLLSARRLQTARACEAAWARLPAAVGRQGDAVIPRPMPIEGARRLGCVVYGRCLEVSREQRWGQTWSCTRCLGPFTAFAGERSLGQLLGLTPTGQPASEPDKEKMMTSTATTNETKVSELAEELGVKQPVVCYYAKKLGFAVAGRTEEQHQTLVEAVKGRTGRGGPKKVVDKSKAETPAREPRPEKRRPAKPPVLPDLEVLSGDDRLICSVLLAAWPTGITTAAYGRVAAVVRALVE